MKQCDVAVTAGGSTIYELSALGVPFICFSCAENQESLVDYVEISGSGMAAGKWHSGSEKTRNRIGELLDELRTDLKKREALSMREKAMVDGRGARRLAKAIIEIWGQR